MEFLFFYLKKLLLATFLLISLPTLVQAKLTAQVDRTQINENDSLTYSLSLDQQTFSQEPNFSALKKDFSILSNSQSNNFSMINGQTRSETTWRLELSPLHTGKLIIPGITLEGQISQAIPIQVSATPQTTKAQANAPLYLTLSANKTTAYLQEQIILTLRVYHQVNIVDGDLGDPIANNAIIKPIGNKKTYTTQVGHTLYKVIEQQYAFFAQNSGQQFIPPIPLNAVIEEESGNPSMDFFSSFNQSNQRNIRLRSNALKLTIKPKPTSYPKNAVWLPTTKITVNVRWNPEKSQLNWGESATQIIQITAEGILGESLTDLKIAPPTGLKNYPDQAQIKNNPTDSLGIIGEKTQSIAWIPTQGGSFFIPQQKIYWWNTQKDQLESKDIPGQTLSVQAPRGSTAPTHPAIQSIINPKKMNYVLPTLIKEDSTRPIRLWKIITAALSGFILILLGGLFYLLHRMKKITAPSNPSIQQTTEDKESSLSKLASKVIKNCTDNNAQRTKQAIHQWISAYAKEQSCSLEAAYAQFNNTDFHILLKQLNDHLYGEQTMPWVGEPLKCAFLLAKQSLSKQKTNTNNQGAHLAELYPK